MPNLMGFFNLQKNLTKPIPYQMKLYVFICLFILFSLNNNGLTDDGQCGWRPYSKIDLDGDEKDRSLGPSLSKMANMDKTRPEDVISTVINGVQSTGRAQNPWLVKVVATTTDPITKSTRISAGTGFIVGQNWILTAQHVVSNLTTNTTHSPSEIQIIIAHNTSEPSRLLNISEMIVHEDFMALRRANKALQADIALLKLVRPLTFTVEVRPLCLLANYNESDKCTNYGSTEPELARQKVRAEVAGYGQTETPSPYQMNDTRWPTEIVHRGLMRFLCPSNCQDLAYEGYKWLNYSIDNAPNLAETNICLHKINENGTRIGTRDSGSPAVLCQHKTTDKTTGTMERCAAVGILSNAIAKVSLASYVRVSYYCAWIECKTEGQVRCEQPSLNSEKMAKKHCAPDEH